MRRMVAPLALLLLGSLVADAGAYPRPGRTTRVSIADDGTQGDLFTVALSTSADGRVVAWDSYATTFVAGDTNDREDVFVHERDRRRTSFVSVSSSGAQSNGASGWPDVSDDGRFVSFSSEGSNLVPGDTNNRRDIFVRDLVVGTTERISVATDGTQSNQVAVLSAISADGRYVAFVSDASNLVPGDANVAPDVFVHDRELGTTDIVSVSSTGARQDEGALYADISGDGRFVAFSSYATNLDPRDTNALQDVYVRDRQTGQTELVSMANDGTAGGGYSREPVISDDGRFVAYESVATNLVPGDTNGISDIFVRDRAEQRTMRVSVTGAGRQLASGGKPFTPGSYFASISGDGRYVAFQSESPTILAGDTNDWDVFVHDLVTGSVTTPAVNEAGAVGNLGAGMPDLGADGQVVAFGSSSSNLVPGDTNNWQDVFVRDRGPSTGVGDLEVDATEETLTVRGWTGLSGAPLADRADPPGDAGEPLPLGAELVGARVAYRPEEGVLAVSWETAGLPGVRGALAGAPAVVHALRFQIQGVPHEIRALRAGATAAPPGAPLFAAYRCEIACVEIARLEGGYGERGEEIGTVVPLATLGIAEGSALAGVTAEAGFGEASSGIAHRLDEVALGDLTVPLARVEVELAGAQGYSEQATVPPLDGRFEATFERDPIPAGHLEVRARACLGAVCGTRTVVLELPSS